MTTQLKRLTALGTIAAIGGVGAAAALSQPSGPSETASSTNAGQPTQEVRTEVIRKTGVLNQVAEIVRPDRHGRQ